MTLQAAPAVQGDMRAVVDLVHGRNGDPFSLLGMQETPEGPVVRSFQPGALGVQVVDWSGKIQGDLALIHPDGLFGGKVASRGPYRLRVEWRDGPAVIEDPYSFGLLLGELDLHLIGEGRHRSLARCLGAHPLSIDDVTGVRFAVWAPNARRVSVVGDFNQWDGRRHPMRKRVEAGVWELFVPRQSVGARYKYEILGQAGTLLPLKADPCGGAAEHPPATASAVPPALGRNERDERWQQVRSRSIASDAPVSIYEVHLGSWMRAGDGGYLTWHDLGDRLVPYAAEMGFTHIELMPITEHPFDGSWGYQPIGLFAPTARFGPPEGFVHFVDRAHAAGLGIILDWVPGHFPTDPHGLALFDGTALYEHADRREGFHHDWNTLIYNFGRHEVRGFLIASALHWLGDQNCDGLRVDAVASMLYRDYSRLPGEWIPNVHGGRENLEAVAFIRELTREVRERVPGAVTIAEESTAWPGVSASESEGGLGFDYKWNMGWMHDTLSYVSRDPVYRPHHHNDITFGLSYAFSERFILPLSHDEVVHGKGSLLGKMPGDRWQKFANLRGYFAFMWAHPGKKLLFMGGEFAQPTEWSHDGSLDWQLLDDPMHRGMQRLVRDLNRLYATMRSLHERDCRRDGFRWVVGDDAANSVFAFLRLGAPGEPPVLVVCNFTPIARDDYRIGVPVEGAWRECLNTDATAYGGSGVGNSDAVAVQKQGAHGYAQSLALRLPPLGVLMLVPDMR